MREKEDLTWRDLARGCHLHWDAEKSPQTKRREAKAGQIVSEWSDGQSGRLCVSGGGTDSLREAERWEGTSLPPGCERNSQWLERALRSRKDRTVGIDLSQAMLMDWYIIPEMMKRSPRVLSEGKTWPTLWVLNGHSGFGVETRFERGSMEAGRPFRRSLEDPSKRRWRSGRTQVVTVKVD